MQIVLLGGMLIKYFKKFPRIAPHAGNALISVHSDGDTTLVILRDMLRSGIKPNEVSFSSLKDPSLWDLRQIH
jgi:hypothetical protein